MENNLKKYKEIWNRIQTYESITIFTHVNPDGDTIGSSVALKELIRIHFPNIEVKISGDKYPYNLNFLPTNDDVSNKYISNSLAILIDASSIARTFDKRITDAKEIIKIDHHHPEGDEWSISIDGDFYPAAGEIIYEMIKLLKLKTNDIICQALFVAIWTDTSGMTERNPSHQTFEAIDWLIENNVDKKKILEYLELSKEDKAKVEKFISNYNLENDIAFKFNDEIIVNDLYRPATEEFVKKIRAKVYVFGAKDELGQIRVGLRSKEIDVSKIAEKFNGGGHISSAGLKVSNESDFNDVIQTIKNILSKKK